MSAGFELNPAAQAAWTPRSQSAHALATGDAKAAEARSRRVGAVLAALPA